MTNHNWEFRYEDAQVGPDGQQDRLFKIYECFRCGARISVDTNLHKYSKQYSLGSIWDGDCDLIIIEQIQNS